MGTLTDDDLRHLLGEAAAAHDVPEDGPEEVLVAAAVAPLHRRRIVQLSAAAAAAAVLLLAGTALFGGNGVDRVGQLAGASNGNSDTAAAEQSDDSAQRAAGRVAAPAPAAALDQVYTSATGGSASGTKAEAPGFAPLADRLTSTGGGVAAGAPAPGAAAPAAPVAADGARVVKTGAIALIVEDDQVTPTLTQVQGFATAVGGVVATSKTQESGETPSGAVTLRVPVDSFEEVVAKVRSMGAEVRSATTSGQDVTAQYADIEAQQRTLSAARERFLEILSRARTIGDVLAVQQRVDDVTGKLDRLEGQRRVLAAQSDQATLEVTVTEKGDPVVAQEQPDTGLSKAFSDAWTGFTTGVEALIRLSGRGVLLLLLLAVASVVLRLAWRVSRRRLV